jgi:hypothetical protein
MREARSKSGFSPDGEVLVAYRSPQPFGWDRKDELSFADWSDQDPLPQFQDHITGYPLHSPTDEEDFVLVEEPNGGPTQQPHHPSFGPRSAVNVPVPWKGEIQERARMLNEVMEDAGRRDEVSFGSDEKGSDTPVRRTRRKVKGTSPFVEKSQRVPVKQRWFYEPVLHTRTQEESAAIKGEPGREGTRALATASLDARTDIVLDGLHSGDSPVSAESNGTRRNGGSEVCGEKTLSVSVEMPGGELEKGEKFGELGARGEQGGKTKNQPHVHFAEFVGSQSKTMISVSKNENLLVSSSEKCASQSDFVVKKENLLGSGSGKTVLTPISSQSDVITLNTGISNIHSDLPSTLGPTEVIPSGELDAASDDEITACRLQGMVFHDDELGWCSVTNWGVDYGTIILFYAPVASSDRAEDEEHASLTEILSMMRQSPMVSRITNYRAS